MNPAKIEAVLSGKRTDIRAAALRLLLGVASPVYGCAARVNRLRYDMKLTPIHRAGAPVISIGNITTGGTGKTPWAAWFVKTIQSRGNKPGLASRGYKSLKNDDPSEAGNDEKLVLEQLCPGVTHLQNRDRVSAARQLVSEFGCDCIILDDGFQHRKLHRDLDVVLIDAVNPFGYGYLLPRGLMREPLSSLYRADIIIITRADQVEAEKILEIREQLSRYINPAQTPIVESVFEPTSLIDQHGNQSRIPEKPGSPIAFCGIGNPKGFEQLLTNLGYRISQDKNFFVFPDHHHYTIKEIKSLCQAAQQAGTNQLLTTQKDIVKLKNISEKVLPKQITCHAICIQASITNGKFFLEQKLDGLFNKEENSGYRKRACT